MLTDSTWQCLATGLQVDSSEVTALELRKVTSNTSSGSCERTLFVNAFGTTAVDVEG